MSQALDVMMTNYVNTVNSVNTLDSNGTISLVVLIPFTHSAIIENDSSIHFGFSQMAAALMAIEHFNARDESLVPNLRELTESCDLVFGNRREIYDTGTVGHIATKALIQSVRQLGNPTAMAGTSAEVPNTEMSVMATSMEIPLVSNRGTNFRLVLPAINPFFTQLNADAFYDMSVVASYLEYTKRTDFIAVLYSKNDANTQRVESLRVMLQGKTVQAEGYFSAGDNILLQEDRDSVFTALQRVKLSGFRTIVLLTPHYIQDFPVLAQVAQDLRLNTGDYVWIHAGVMDMAQFDYMESARENKTLLKFLQGSAMMMSVDQWKTQVNAGFLDIWKQQNASFVDQLNQWFPLAARQRKAPQDYFQLEEPHLGSVFLYDAIMMIGLGACHAVQNTNKSSTPFLSGYMHHQAIQQLDFQGASGRVHFHGPADATPGSRVGETVTYGMFNLYPPNRGKGELFYELTDLTGGSFGSDMWTRLEPFVYADGSNTPPELLRDTPEQNYLGRPVQAVALTILSLVWFAALASAFWIYRHRTEHVVAAGQPVFLYCLLVGASLTASVILPVSFDESHGWSEDMLDKACAVGPWLGLMGHILTYSALFTKLWRINKVLQFKRRQILIRHVAWPMVTLFVAAVGILTAWTVVSNIRWSRREIDDLTGESIGLCVADDAMGTTFIVIAAVLVLIPTALTLVMAYKTKDIDAKYSESSWIFILVLIQFQVIIVGVPVIIILQDVSTTGRYIGLTLLAATMSSSVIALMIIPRVLAYNRALREKERAPKRSSSTSRGAGGGKVSVTGITSWEQRRQRRRQMREDKLLRKGLENDSKSKSKRQSGADRGGDELARNARSREQ